MKSSQFPASPLRNIRLPRSNVSGIFYPATTQISVQALPTPSFSPSSFSVFLFYVVLVCSNLGLFLYGSGILLQCMFDPRHFHSLIKTVTSFSCARLHISFVRDNIRSKYPQIFLWHEFIYVCRSF